MISGPGTNQQKIPYALRLVSSGLLICEGTNYKRKLSHLYSELSQLVWRFLKYLTNKSIFRKTFEGEMLVKNQTTLIKNILWTLALFKNHFQKYESSRWYFQE